MKCTEVSGKGIYQLCLLSCGDRRMVHRLKVAEGWSWPCTLTFTQYCVVESVELSCSNTRFTCRGCYKQGHNVCVLLTHSLAKCVSGYWFPEYDFRFFLTLFSQILRSVLNYAKRASSPINLIENSVNMAIWVSFPNDFDSWKNTTEGSYKDTNTYFLSFRYPRSYIRKFSEK
jgi:hypothetical protein